MTPHIAAKQGDYAPTVLMPGDPLRAKWIADTFLEDCKQVNSIRNCFGYTGYYNGSIVSVQASGMGQPSLGIYAHELYKFYGVKNIIRVGSCGGIAKRVKLGDIIVGIAAVNDADRDDLHLNWPYANAQLLLKFVESIPKEIKHHVGTIVSTDQFYHQDKNWWEQWKSGGVLAVDMESYLLYNLAIKFNKKALTVCTVSDLIHSKESMTPYERETGFSDMIKIVLETL